MKKIKWQTEPVLRIHRYVVVVAKERTSKKHGKFWGEKYFYAVNKKEVDEFKERAPKGSIVSVFRATHEFAGSWEKEK